MKKKKHQNLIALEWHSSVGRKLNFGSDLLLHKPFQDRPLTFLVETASQTSIALQRTFRKLSLSSSLILTVMCKKDKLKQKLGWFFALACQSDGEDRHKYGH